MVSLSVVLMLLLCTTSLSMYCACAQELLVPILVWSSSKAFSNNNNDLMMFDQWLVHNTGRDKCPFKVELLTAGVHVQLLCSTRLYLSPSTASVTLFHV